MLDGARFGGDDELRSQPKDNPTGPIFREASLQSASLLVEDWDGANFERANLSGSAFIACTLPRTNFQCSNLEAPGYSTPSLPSPISAMPISAVPISPVPTWRVLASAADLTQCNLKEAVITGVDFASAKHYDAARTHPVKSGPAPTEIDGNCPVESYED